VERSVGRGAWVLALTVTVLLIAPTVIGVLLDVILNTAPAAAVGGSLAGVAAACIVITRTVLRRIAELAPPEPEEETTE